jgi:hypothetical protein
VKVKTVRPFLALLMFSGAASAADSPAQVGYCVESLRELIALAPDDGQTAKYRPLFEQWRLLGLSLPPDASFEFLRGISTAKTDWAMSNAEAAAEAAECNKTPDPGTCFIEKLKSHASDPTVLGMKERAAPCMKGPSL